MEQFDLERYLKELEYLVNIDSGSKSLEGVAQIGEYFSEKFKAAGWNIKKYDIAPEIAPCIEITNRDTDRFDILLLGHMDTVFPAGTVKERPFTIKDGKAYGPGVIDMKSGLLSAYYALDGLKDQELSICLLLNSEEEMGSRRVRPWLEKAAGKSRYVFVLEAARENGDLVLTRKGLGRYTFEFHGVAAHAGVAPQNGISAILELGHWIVALHGLTDFSSGLTLNVGTVVGGTTANVVADYAKAELDFRVADMSQVHIIKQKIDSLLAHAKTSGVKIGVSGGMTRPPLNPTEETQKICRLAETIGKELDMTVHWAKTGGGSDGNFSAALGVPTIDGLGPVGGNAHGTHEYMLIESVEPRIHLLRRMIKEAVQVK
ncbi:MAG: peptidase [Firmicutes bacterium]|nr:peptidase [Bacillota bacterium]